MGGNYRKAFKLNAVASTHQGSNIKKVLKDDTIMKNLNNSPFHDEYD